MFTRFHANSAATCLCLTGRAESSVPKRLSAASVHLQPYQIEAALFALQSPFSKGVLLADETGLGKTIEGALVIAQRWAERRRNILVIVPASLRTQWAGELDDEFDLPSTILTKRPKSRGTDDIAHSEDRANTITIVSYQYAANNAADLKQVAWDLIVIDEAHRLRNIYKAPASSGSRRIKEIIADRFTLLLTATPLQNSLMELIGVVSTIDGALIKDRNDLKLLFGGQLDEAAVERLRERLAPFCLRHLRRDVQAAGYTRFTARHVLTLDFTPSDAEVDLYDAISAYLSRSQTVAFGSPPNAMLLMIARKIVGSSTAAIIRFLDRVIARLKAGLPMELAALAGFDVVQT